MTDGTPPAAPASSSVPVPPSPRATRSSPGVARSISSTSTRSAGPSRPTGRRPGFCAHPYLLRLLGLTAREVTEHRDAALAGDRREIPGAVRASAGVSMTRDEIDRFLAAVRSVATEPEPPVPYDQDAVTSDYWPLVDAPGWTAGERRAGAPCSRG